MSYHFQPSSSDIRLSTAVGEISSARITFCPPRLGEGENPCFAAIVAARRIQTTGPERC